MPRERTPAVYIVASQTRGTIYTGVTSDPLGRIYQHRERLGSGFAATHNARRVVFLEFHETMESAIAREKQIKNWHRPWKINLIEASNPTWRDLALEYGFEPRAPKRPSAQQ